MDDNIIKGRKILVVEDDLSSRLYLNKILEKAEVTIFNAGNGQEAIDIVLSHYDIDVVLMDIQLPVVDGYAAAKKMKEFRKDLIIIAQTAFGLSDEKEKILNSGFDDYLIKPIFSHNLIDKIKLHLVACKNL
jgi:CheY-like chemotaxis protein